MKASMKTTLLGLGIIVTVIPVAVMSGFIKIMGVDIAQSASKEFRNMSIESARQTTIDLRQMCDIIKMSGDYFSSSAKDSVISALSELGQPNLTKETSPTTIRSQLTPTEETIRQLPSLVFGKVKANPTDASSPDEISKILIRLKERLKCDFTIFQKISEDGDMLRVASTISTIDGGKMVGTYFPAHNQNGTRQNVISTIMSGAMFSGIVNVGQMTLSANYFPIRNYDDNIIGAIFFGVRQNAVDELEKYMRTLNMGKNTVVWIVDNSSPDNPVLRLSQDISANGILIKDDAALKRKEYLLDIISKSERMRSNEVSTQEISVVANDGKVIKKVVTFTSYRPWNWIIGTVSDLEEFSDSATEISLRASALMHNIIYAGIFVTLLSIGISWVLASKMSKPLKMLKRVAKAQSQADIATAEKILNDYCNSNKITSQELDQLTNSVLNMTIRLSNLIANVRKTGEFVARRTSEISSAADRLDVISIQEREGVDKILENGKNIALSFDILNKTAKGSVQDVTRTLNATGMASQSLDLLRFNSEALSGASEKLILRLAEITSNVEKITTVVSTIGDVSKKMNTLSLNASVEAEKAGESGVGFAVVARKIRELADHTATASLDIENNSRMMQSAVNSGVMEMDLFAAKMRQNSEIILNSTDALSRIINDVEEVGPKFEEIASNISALSQLARNISSTMLEISVSATRSQGKLVEFKQASARLDATSEILLTEVSKFKTTDIKGGLQ